MTTLEKLEDLIYRGFKETAELQKETARQSQETARQSQETVRQSQETERRFQEAERRFQETERLIHESNQETRRRFQDTDRLLKDYAREQKADSEKLRIQMYGLTKSLGLFAESMVYPSVVRLFAERGIALTGAYTRSRERRNGSTMEVDVLGVGAKSIVAIEVKTRLEQSDVKAFLNRLPQFFEFFPRFRGLKLYGAVAGMSIDQEVDRYAYKNGLFVLAPSGDNIQILNDEKFIPRVFEEPSKKDQRRKK